MRERRRALSPLQVLEVAFWVVGSPGLIVLLARQDVVLGLLAAVMLAGLGVLAFARKVRGFGRWRGAGAIYTAIMAIGASAPTDVPSASAPDALVEEPGVALETPASDSPTAPVRTARISIGPDTMEEPETGSVVAVSSTPDSEEPTITSGPAGPVTVERADAACVSLPGIVERLDNLAAAMEGRGDFSKTLPEPPPECIGLHAGTTVQATGRRSAYTLGGTELWLAEIEHDGERRWAMESMFSSGSGGASTRKSAPVDRRGWTAWQVGGTTSALTDMRGIALISVGPPAEFGLEPPFVMLMCHEERDREPQVALRDGRFHFGGTSVAYRFDDGEVVRATFRPTSGDGDGGVYETGEHYQRFKDGLAAANRLRFQVEGAEVFDVSLAGSTAALREYEEQCAVVGARH